MSALTVAAALAGAQKLGLDRLDAQLLLAHLLQRDRGWLIGHDDALLAPQQAQRYADLLARRAAGEPFAYLVGEQEFHGLRLAVTPDTLVPRADTETLVDWALELLPGLGAAPRVVDLGTGSGAIALALKHRHPAARVQAVDLSAAALAVAAGNARRLGLDVAFAQGSWWQ
ncbi:MAG: HemK family protein methyltransferase, partial [Burkholderiaceae bacterium]